MSRPGRLRAEGVTAARAFLRRRTAVFFTFVFPLLIVLIFGVLVQTDAGGAGGGIFGQPTAWYVPGYLAVVVLFTPLSRVGSEVARHRDGNRFEKLATTPLSRTEWLFAHSMVNSVIIGIAGLLVLVSILTLTGAAVALGPATLLLVPFLFFGVVLFCGVGAFIGSLADSQDGVIAASNAIALPLLFLSETFVSRSMLPTWLPTELSPLTYFSRGVRALTYAGGAPAEDVLGVWRGPSWPGDPLLNLLVLAVVAMIALGIGARALPTTD